MKADIKAKWVADLRSGKFPQTDNCLRNSYGFCCLGVLCDLYSRETGEEWETGFSNQFSMHGNDNVLPLEVRVWADLPHEHGAYVTAAKCYDEGEDTKVYSTPSLTELNDQWQYDFKQIADVIEEQL
jgi:hypothetical protein